jgi:HEPN domain-containing protein
VEAGVVTGLEEIERELAMAEAALRDANEGKARVCARRAVGLAMQASLERCPRPGWRGDAMNQLRQIQQEKSFPLPIRQAAERLSTKITQRDTAPFTSNPIADARVIIAHLMSAEHETKSGLM